MKKVFFLVCVTGSLLLTAPSNAQCLDKFGFSAGYTHSTMRWANSKLRLNLNAYPFDPYISGISILGFAEKSLNKTIAIRSQIGYICQGYGSSEDIRYADSPPYPVGNVEGYRFHQLALDLGTKVTLSKGCLTPYLTAGIRNNYSLAFQVLNPYAGMEGSRILLPSDFNRYAVSATLGMGMEICHAFFIEAEYSPALSNSIRYDSYRGRSHSYGFKVGYFLFNKKQSCRKKFKNACNLPIF